jgi:hypothetical protein
MRLASARLLILSGSLMVTTQAQAPAPQTYTLSAEITQDDMRVLVTVYRDGSKERIEMAAQGAPRKRITLLDFDAHKVYWLFPGQDPACSSGRYLSDRAPVGEDLATGSAQMLADLPKGSQRKFVRQEAVNGMPARVEEISYPANTLWAADEARPSRVWLSEPEGVILKIDGAKRGAKPSTVLEVKQFTREKPQAALLATPAGCVVTDSEMDDSGTIRAHAEGAVSVEAKGEVNLADKTTRSRISVTESKAPVPAGAASEGKAAPPAVAAGQDRAVTPGAVSAVTLQVSEVPGPAPCGRKLAARGTVTVDGPAKVWYRFYANVDGLRFSSGPEGNVGFGSAGSATLTKDITFPAAKTGDLKFEAAVRTLDGRHDAVTVSNAAPFSIPCVAAR